MARPLASFASGLWNFTGVSDGIALAGKTRQQHFGLSHFDVDWQQERLASFVFAGQQEGRLLQQEGCETLSRETSRETLPEQQPQHGLATLGKISPKLAKATSSMRDSDLSAGAFISDAQTPM